MDDLIELEEHGECTVLLSEAEKAAIRRHLSAVLQIWPTEHGGQYILRASSLVGFATLPGGRTIRIEPKVPVETLFALLAAVYDPSRETFREEPQPYSTVEALFEFVASIFASHVEDLIARGVLRGYRARTDDAPAIRGRLLFAETLRHRPALHDKHWCTYTHFTPDVPENRILRWTAHCLQPHSYREVALPGRLRRVGRALTDVALDPEARRLFERLQFHRLNDPYRPALALARLLLDHLSFSGTAGKDPFLAYIVDMDWLFEAYVTALIGQVARECRLQLHAQDRRFLDVGRKVTVKPDAILSRMGSPQLVLDAKYKLDAAQGDLYQVLAYCHALGIAQAALVHPATEQAPVGIVHVLGAGDVRVRYLSVDLRGNLGQLAVQEVAFRAQVAEMLAEAGQA